ncbi:MAG TPA: nucleotidyltransferase domain-containing protein [Streptosporangiaceae bacterium]|nr:nucleotidyltransferase domain-containing protein [Streptosporangiaceae bacterium]
MELNRPLTTVTPTLDGDVLNVLAQQETAFTTGQIRRVLGSYSEEGIRKVLARLTRQGVVHAERVGNAYSYQLNREHLAAEHIIGLTRLKHKLLIRLEERLRAWTYPPVYAAIFGSAARGTMTADSDLDVFLVRADDTPLADWEAQVTTLAAEVTSWTGNDTRPLEYAVSQLGAAWDEPVVQAVIQDGLTITGSRAWLSGEVSEGRE